VNDELLVGMVGNLAPSKGHLGFIEAAALIKRQSARPVKFVIVGRDLELWRAYSDQLRATVTTLGLEGDVRFEGYRADIADVLSAFDVLVVPSHWEPLGVIVMEGMAAGKPIVATDAGGIPEMVHDGVEALLFPPQDAQKLADAVLRLTTNAVLAANLAANARRRVWDAFSPQQAATAYAWLYDSMAQPDRSTGIAAPREFVAAGLAGEKPEAQS
jgi:glycosyltransferase involved in cell wall biosynthesis